MKIDVGIQSLSITVRWTLADIDGCGCQDGRANFHFVFFVKMIFFPATLRSFQKVSKLSYQEKWVTRDILNFLVENFNLSLPYLILILNFFTDYYFFNYTFFQCCKIFYFLYHESSPLLEILWRIRYECLWKLKKSKWRIQYSKK